MARTFASAEAAQAWLKERLAQAAKDAALSTAIRIHGHIINDLIPAQNPQPVDRGVYRAGWKYQATEDGAEVYNASPVAPIVEWGARAENIKVGRAMLSALEEWIKRKGLTPEESGKGEDADRRAMAWAIAMSMKKKGIFNRDGKKGLRIAEQAREKVAEYFAQEYADEIRRIND